MNLGEIRRQVDYLVNFNEGTADQSFAGPATDANRHIDDAINESYREEVRLGKLHGNRSAFRKVFPFTWPANTEFFPIPAVLKEADIEILLDETGGITPGIPVEVSQQGQRSSSFYLRDRDTWGWINRGAERSLVAIILAKPMTMQNDSDIPDLIPSDLHDLLKWSAGCLLRHTADDKAPPMWLVRREDLRKQFWKLLALKQPMQYPAPRIRNNSPDFTNYYW